MNHITESNSVEIRDNEGGYVRISEEQLISMARYRVKCRLNAGPSLTSAAESRRYLQVLLEGVEHEEFWVIWLTSQHKVLAAECLFKGTIDAAAVYPREVVKAALGRNAAAVIIAHNHPSGVSEPSQADRRITERLQKALELIDVRVLDHFVIGVEEVTSFAERGWI